MPPPLTDTATSPVNSPGSMQQRTGLSPGDLQTIVQAVQSVPQVRQLLLFGSRAKGSYKPGSDVDLAIKGENITYDITVQLASTLNQTLRLPYFFDVLDYHSIAEPKLLEHIDRVGLALFDAG